MIFEMVLCIRMAGSASREPCAVFVVEQRSQLVVHPAVVTVEPFDFLRVEQGPVYRFHVDGTEGERVELEECAEPRFPDRAR